MNKQELIEKYKSALNKVHKVYGDYYKTEAYEEVLKDLKQLDEPDKPVVPQFVADWYEENKDDFEYNVWDWIFSKDEPEKIQSEFAFWVNDVENNPIQTLVNMHQFGYEVEKEKEKRYYVRFKFIEDSYSYLTLIKHLNAWTLSSIKLDKKFRTEHTRKELEEAGFGEVFNSPLFEVEEMEE
jgi:gp178